MHFYVRPGSSFSLEAAQAQLMRYLANKEALLVLDNCEHLIAGQLVDLIANLLAAAPGVKLIATSCERLNLPGEWVLEVAGLSFPGSDGGEDIPQYAAEKLATDPSAYAEARTRHARYYSKWLSLMNEKLKGSEQMAALVALQAETQNLHDAWRWLIEQRDLERLHGVLPAMILFHEMRGRPVGAQEIVRLLCRRRRTHSRFVRCQPAGRSAPFRPDAQASGANGPVPTGKPGHRTRAARRGDGSESSLTCRISPCRSQNNTSLIHSSDAASTAFVVYWGQNGHRPTGGSR
jgi:hypothetical protein